ncbi:hypothetical protein RB213_012018 [Colletotrichum asianum]
MPPNRRTLAIKCDLSFALPIKFRTPRSKRQTAALVRISVQLPVSAVPLQNASIPGSNCAANLASYPVPRTVGSGH